MQQRGGQRQRGEHRDRDHRDPGLHPDPRPQAEHGRTRSRPRTRRRGRRRSAAGGSSRRTSCRCARTVRRAGWSASAVSTTKTDEQSPGCRGGSRAPVLAGRPCRRVGVGAVPVTVVSPVPSFSRLCKASRTAPAFPRRYAAVMPADPAAPLTPDRRVRVFVSSTLQELAPERQAAREAVTRLRLTPVMFELGARPHPPRELYRAYLAQSDVFVGIYWQRYGWVAPGRAGLRPGGRVPALRRPAQADLRQGGRRPGAAADGAAGPGAGRRPGRVQAVPQQRGAGRPASRTTWRCC